MKTFIKRMTEDYREENFSVSEWILAFAFCVAIFGVCFAADLIYNS